MAKDLQTGDNPEAPSEVDDEDARFWLTEIDAAKERVRDWHDKADKARTRYKDCKGREFGWLNILWANVETQKAALGEDFGKPDVTRANVPDDDGLTRYISLVWQRAIDAAVRDDNDNHEISLAVHDVLLPGRGQVWLELNPVKDYDGNIQWVEAPLVRVCYQDYLEGPSTSWKSLPWAARAHLFTLDDLRDRFPELGAKVDDIPREFELPMPDNVNESWAKENKGKEQFKRARVWEIWAKYPDKRRIYVAEGYDVQSLRVDPDPYNLRNFFPCPRAMVANADESWQEPLTDYSRYEDQALEVDRLSTRIYVLTDVLKRRGVYDSRFPDLANLPSMGDNELIPVANFAELAQSGGLTKAIEWEDLSVIAEMLVELHKQRNELIGLIYELTGISDLARGMTDPNETATAQKLKQAFGSGRFSARQTESRRFAADAYAIKGELMAEHFPRQQLQEMCGMPLPTEAEQQQAQKKLQMFQVAMQRAQQMGLQPPQLSPKQQRIMRQMQRIAGVPFTWGDVAEVLQSQYRRCYRVGLETDQTQFKDEESDKSARIEFFKAVTAIIEQMAPLIKANPANGEIFKEMIMFVVRGFRAGRTLEEGIETALDNLIKQAQQAAMQPQQPQVSPVDQARIGLMNAQKDQAETTAELNQQKLQGGGQVDVAKMQREEAAAQVKLQGEQVKTAAAIGQAHAKQIGSQVDIQGKMERLQFEREERASAAKILSQGGRPQDNREAA